MATPHTVSFHTLGCKLNFSETSSIKHQFESRGYNTVPFEEGADVYIINTCSVTDFADKKCRYEVRRALKHSPDAKIVVIGCYAQLKPKEISEIEGVDLVLGAAEKFNILSYIDELSSVSEKGMIKAGEISQVNNFVDAFSFGDRTRSFLKVQDGCDYKCTFCTIPMARGQSRSDTIENVVSNTYKIAEKGVKEIVLTGVNIGDFGNGTAVIEGTKPKKEAMFIDLARALDEVEVIKRFRISSIEPNLCTPEVIDFVEKSDRFVPHFHIPLQSGSNKILKLMRRRYKKELYAERVDYIKSKIPDCCIGVDIIVGFPGETEEDFNNTYDFVKELDVSYFHVFTYSERSNTLASEMEGKVDMGVRKERNKKLRILSEKKKRAFYQKYIDTEHLVLLENSKTEGKLNGFTANYIKIEIDHTSQISEGDIVLVLLKEITDTGIVKAALVNE
ncbi:MAG: tRNA (N(6)-L-threonylcarbamoyladenosine(37)-C(2))-methylthiotransferase MtaB [Saprospiraceae bacterium]